MIPCQILKRRLTPSPLNTENMINATKAGKIYKATSEDQFEFRIFTF